MRVYFDQYVTDIGWVTSTQIKPCVDGQVFSDVQITIPEEGIYRIRITANDCAESRECIYWLSSCGAYEIVETACHTFEIRSNNLTGTPGDNRVVIRDLGTNEVVADEVVPISALPYQIINDHDTVYAIEVTGPDGLTWKTELIDLCDLRTCRKSLVAGLFCEDLCETNGDKLQEGLTRSELMRISMLISQLENEVYSYRYRFTGLFEYGEERIESLTSIAALVRTAHKLSARCAKCTQKTPPCTDC